MKTAIALAAIAGAFLAGYAAAQQPAAIQSKTLAQGDRAWDGNVYRAYPVGQPQVSVLEIAIPPRTTMDWHQHPMPNAAYVMSGEIRVETREGQTSTFKEGQIILETVAKPHRGVTLEQPVKLLVFYAGAAGMPLSERAPTR